MTDATIQVVNPKILQLTLIHVHKSQKFIQQDVNHSQTFIYGIALHLTLSWQTTICELILNKAKKKTTTLKCVYNLVITYMDIL